VPDRVRGLADGGEVRPVWVNEAGGITFELNAGARRRFVKWAPAGSGINLSAESARLSWAGRFARVPALLEQGADDAGSWIVTSALPLGEADRWADLAVATWSVGWSYGTRWEQRLLDACGVEAEQHRTRYYRLLYDLCP
jgi:kanamycin kinase